MNNLWKIALVLASFSWLTGCTNAQIIGCPEVVPWSQADQSGLLREITSKPNGHDFKEMYPYTYKALKQYQDMRVTSTPCSLRRPLD